jgi:hypothetical protein
MIEWRDISHIVQSEISDDTTVITLLVRKGLTCARNRKKNDPNSYI